MLCFAGLGLSGIESISLEIQKLLKDADVVYLEQFTSPISKLELNKIKKIVKGEFKIAKRWMVEDGKEILKNSKKKKVILLTYVDPFIATTHIELRTRAIQEKIKTKIIHAASAITALVGECGLHYYKVGRLVTIMNDLKSMTTPYYVIYTNALAGNHTVLLLEYNQDAKFFLEPSKALEDLLTTEKEQKRKIISPSTFAIIASRIGFKNQKITAGKISSLLKQSFGKPPHSIIIPGQFHFTESDALKIFANCLDEPLDNSKNIKKISKQMMEKYVPMVRKAIEEISPFYKNSKEFQEVLENAELYIKDAEKFLEQGKDEVAILSIGYADGLVDSLRIAKGLDPKM
ncbi:MAG TPA: diphthine synthase [Nitrosopumilaceae archaeon]|nr:diphthine synthase [Nitrosopumilaceae archaeon]